MATNDFLKGFLDSQFSTPKDGQNEDKGLVSMGKRVVELKSRAVSESIELDKLPLSFRGHVETLAARILDPESKYTIVTGQSRAGKSFLIESFVLNLDKFLVKSSLNDLKFIVLNEADMLEIRNSEDFRMYVAELLKVMKLSDYGEICFYTEALEIADFVAKTMPEVRILLEINMHVFAGLSHISAHTTTKSWSSWQVSDANQVQMTVDDMATLIHGTTVKRLENSSSPTISKAQIKRFIKYVLKQAPSLAVQLNEDFEITVVPPGLWAYSIRHILGEIAHSSDPSMKTSSGKVNYPKVFESVFRSHFAHFMVYSTEGGINTDGLNDIEARADEVRKILESEGQGMASVATASSSKMKVYSEGDFSDMSTLKARLSKPVIGQDDAIGKTVSGLTIPAAGLNDPRKPIRSFAFLGPTGVGKTELALNLAKELMTEEMNVVRINMSEYQMEHEVSKLFGAPPGYLGFEKGGMLTSAVMSHPRSVVLLDEVEKAHPKVWDTLLQILDAGMMTDGQGQVVDFTQTVVIMTSNIGADEMVKKRSGFIIGSSSINEDEDNRSMSSIAIKALEKIFRPELINRIDEVIVFNRLSINVVKSIISREIEIVSERMKRRGNVLTKPSNEILDFLVSKSDISKYGAREVQRVVFKNVSSVIASFILEKPTTRKISLAVRDGKVTVEPESKMRRGK